ncbi:MAG: phospholipase D-like domain-containing protein [Acidobacteriota bacterium]
MKTNLIQGNISLRDKIFYYLMTMFIVLILCQGCNSTGIHLEIVTSMPEGTDLVSRGTRSTAEVWVELIKGAEENIDLAEFYLISKKGELLESVINSLVNAAKRGVKIRILSDKKMMGTYPEVVKRLKIIKNIFIRIFNWEKRGMGILHAKYFIVDDKRAFVGSQNFDWRSLKHIHETGILVEEPGIVKNLKAIFEADWEFNGGNLRAYDHKDVEKIVMGKNLFLTASPESLNPRGIKSTIKIIRESVRKAKKKVTVQLLNYQANRYKSEKKFTELENELKNAGKRGVIVKILVSDWNLRKHQIAGIKELAESPGIEVKVASIPVHSSGFIPFARVIHSKVMRVDENLCMVSTSNWGYGYFYSSRNVEIFFRSKKHAKILDLLFNDLWDSQYTFTLDPGKEYKEPKIN